MRPDRPDINGNALHKISRLITMLAKPTPELWRVCDPQTGEPLEWALTREDGDEGDAIVQDAHALEWALAELAKVWPKEFIYHAVDQKRDLDGFNKAVDVLKESLKAKEAQP